VTADAAFAAWVLDSMSSGVLAVDAAGDVAVLNAGARRILGLAEDAAPGRPCREVLAGQPGVARLLEEALRRPGRLSRAELALAAGASRPPTSIGLTLWPVHDPAGRLRGAALLFRDLAPIERGDEQLRLRDRLAALGQMAAALAHEIRNPLASMEVGAALLRRRLDADPEGQGLVAELLGELRRIAATVTASLDFVRPVVLERARFAPAALVEEALATARARVPFEGRVERDYAAAPPEVSADRERLRGAVAELIANALESMRGREGMRLALRVAVREAAPPLEAPPELVVCVTDSGPGIAAELRAKVFTPFFTTRERGSGVGLAQVQKIAAAHGGAIELDGLPGACTFRLRLPLAPEAA
jgi:two-component system nitrogen regulation sensor histidine kinase GlnL